MLDGATLKTLVETVRHIDDTVSRFRMAAYADAFHRLGVSFVGAGLSRVVIEKDGLVYKIPRSISGERDNEIEFRVWGELDEEHKQHFVPALALTETVLVMEYAGETLASTGYDEEQDGEPRYDETIHEATRHLGFILDKIKGGHCYNIDLHSDNISHDWRILDYAGY